MKKCPVCNQTYADDRLAYCLEDGTALVNAPAANSAQSAITQPSPRVKYNPEPTLRVPPGQFSTAVTQTSPTGSKSGGKGWLIFALAGLFLVVVVGAVIVFIALRGSIGSSSEVSNTPVANSNVSENKQITSVTPLPETSHTSADLVGTWKTSVVENKIPTDITVTLAASGNSTYVFKTKNRQTSRDTGAWHYTDGTLFENFSNGATGKSSIKWIDNDTIDLTIIDNGVPSFTGVVRRYRRVN